MNKRGWSERQMIWTFYMLIVILILIATMSFINGAISNDRINRISYAEELGMVLNQFYGLNSDVELEYSFDGCFQFEVENNEVIITDQDGGISKSKIFVDKYGSEFEYSGDFIEKVVFEKEGDVIRVKDTGVCKDE